MRMKFVNRKLDPETQVRITLNQDENHLDLMMNDHLVGFFADGKLYLCSFGPANKDMYALENQGVKFVKVQGEDNSYRISVE